MTGERMNEILTELYDEIEEAIKQSESIKSSEDRAEMCQQALIDARFWLIEGMLEIQTELRGERPGADQQVTDVELSRRKMKILN